MQMIVRRMLVALALAGFAVAASGALTALADDVGPGGDHIVAPATADTLGPGGDVVAA
jgi:hypothetical protein